MRLRDRLSTVGILLVAMCLQAGAESPVRIQIRVVNAKNGKSVANQKVSVSIKGVRDASEYTTDDEGTISVDLDSTAEVFAATEWWTTCRKMESGVDPYVSVADVLQVGVVVPNNCGKAKSEITKGKLIVFARKTSLWRLFQR